MSSGVRNDGKLSNFDETVPDKEKYGKHRSCYSIYTNPDHLKRLQSKACVDKTPSSLRSSSQQSSSGKFIVLKNYHLY